RSAPGGPPPPTPTSASRPGTASTSSTSTPRPGHCPCWNCATPASSPKWSGRSSPRVAAITCTSGRAATGTRPGSCPGSTTGGGAGTSSRHRASARTGSATPGPAPSTWPPSKRRRRPPDVTTSFIDAVKAFKQKKEQPPHQAAADPFDSPAAPADPFDAPAAPPGPAGGGDRAAGYAAAALDREADAVRTAPQGTRNHALNKAAFSLGQLVAGG